MELLCSILFPAVIHALSPLPGPTWKPRYLPWSATWMSAHAGQIAFMAALTRGDGVLPEGDADRLGQVQGQVGDPGEVLEEKVQGGHRLSGGADDDGDVVGVCPDQKVEPGLLESAEAQVDDYREE